MDPRVQVIAVIGAAALLLELVRRRAAGALRPAMWLFSAVFLLVLGFWRGLLEDVSALLGIAEPPNALFFLAFAAILVLLLHLSVALSRPARSKMLAQRLALREERLGRAERPASGAGQPELEPQREIEQLPR